MTFDEIIKMDPRKLKEMEERGYVPKGTLEYRLKRLPDRPLYHTPDEIYNGVKSPPSKMRLLELQKRFGETPRPENTRDVEDIEEFDKAVKDAEDKRRND